MGRSAGSRGLAAGGGRGEGGASRNSTDITCGVATCRMTVIPLANHTPNRRCSNSESGTALQK